MTIEDLMKAVNELRRLGYDPTAPELDCMIYCDDEGEAFDAYMTEYGGGDYRDEVPTAAALNEGRAGW